MADRAELLIDLSPAELEALANCTLVPAALARLNDLMERKRESSLSTQEQAELDRILDQTEQLTLLKTRARYTLSRTQAEVAGA